MDHTTAAQQTLDVNIYKTIFDTAKRKKCSDQKVKREKTRDVKITNTLILMMLRMKKIHFFSWHKRISNRMRI